ncbi:hypothetical protein NE664_00060 [Anaerotignum faecicola]|nr:hypothetical protein [Anaerotignum faecicola]
MLNHISVKSSADKCIKILLLSDRETRLYSNAPQKDVDNAANMIHNKKNRLLSTSAKLAILENIVKKGVKRVVGNDVKKTAFASEIMGKYDEKFVKDVLNKYYFDHPYKMAIGTTIQELCTNQFIKIFEETIFNEHISKKYMHGNYKYTEYFKGLFNSIYNKISEDVSSAIPYITYIRSENNNTAATALNLNGFKKYGLNIDNNILIKLKAMVDDDWENIFFEIGKEKEFSIVKTIDELIEIINKPSKIFHVTTNYSSMYAFSGLITYKIPKNAFALAVSKILFVTGIISGAYTFTSLALIEDLRKLKDKGYNFVTLEIRLKFDFRYGDPTTVPCWNIILITIRNFS